MTVLPATKRHTTAVAAALAASVLWASIPTIARALITGGADPLALTVYRCVLAFSSLLIILLFVGRGVLSFQRTSFTLYLLYGLAVAINYGCYFKACEYATASMAIVLLYTYPIIVAILSHYFFKEKIDTKTLAALVTAFAGVFLLAKGYSLYLFLSNLLGLVYGIGAALGMAFYTLIGKRLVQNHSPWAIVLYGFGFGGAFLFLASVKATVHAGFSTTTWLGVLALALGPTVLAYALFTFSLKHLQATEASMICTVEPLAGVIIAAIFLRELLDGPQVIGGILIITGVLLIEYRRPPGQLEKIDPFPPQEEKSRAQSAP